jgi:hypothetical protein
MLSSMSWPRRWYGSGGRRQSRHSSASARSAYWAATPFAHNLSLGGWPGKLLDTFLEDRRGDPVGTTHANRFKVPTVDEPEVGGPTAAQLLGDLGHRQEQRSSLLHPLVDQVINHWRERITQGVDEVVGEFDLFLAVLRRVVGPELMVYASQIPRRHVLGTIPVGVPDLARRRVNRILWVELRRSKRVPMARSSNSRRREETALTRGFSGSG